MAGADWVKIGEEFRRVRESAAPSDSRRQRWARAAEFAGWLDQDSLSSLSLDQALALYRASGCAKTAAFKLNPIEEIRDALDFLLYDTVKLEGRFEECAADGGGFKLEGAGKEFVSYILCLQEPALFAVWNSNAESMLRRAGALTRQMKSGPLGIRYLDMLEALSHARSRLGLPDFQALDELCYLTSSRRAKTA